MRFKKGDYLFGIDEEETIIKIKSAICLGDKMPRSILINNNYSYWESLTNNKKKSIKIRTIGVNKKEIKMKINEPVKNSQKFFLKIQENVTNKFLLK